MVKPENEQYYFQRLMVVCQLRNHTKSNPLYLQVENTGSNRDIEEIHAADAPGNVAMLLDASDNSNILNLVEQESS